MLMVFVKMSESGINFSSSVSDIIKSYSKELESFIVKCKKKISTQKALVNFDKQLWTAFRITMLCSVLSSLDLFKYLIEIGFVVDEKSSICRNCTAKMSLVITIVYVIQIFFLP